MIREEQKEERAKRQMGKKEAALRRNTRERCMNSK